MLEKIIEYVSKKIIENLWGNYTNKIKNRDAELIEITDTFGSVETLLKYYIEPKCQNINPANYNEDEPDAVVRTPVFDFLNTYFNREFVVHGDGRNQLFILSDAGLGKTSLLLMIKLCETLPKKMWNYDLENENRVELIKLDSAALGKARAIENKNKTILLLDALDEDPLSWQKPEKRLLKVLQSSSGFKRVIISCRTQFFPEKGVSTYGTQEKISLGGYVCPMVFLSPFDEKQVYDYLQKRFPVDENKDNPAKIEKALGILSKAKSLSFRPFLLSHIEDLLDSQNQDWTELSIYNELVDVWIRREVRKPNSKLEEDDLFLSCMAIASKMQESGKRHLSKNELAKIIKAIPEIGYINNIEHGAKSLLNRTSSGDYRFSHFSIQEFFLAKYITSLGSNVPKEQRVNRVAVSRNKIRITFKALEFIAFSQREKWQYGDPFLLEGLKLDGFDFSNGNWSGCSFKNSSMTDCSFEEAKLNGANFTNTNLSNTKFDSSECNNTNFQNANLTKADLINVNSKGVNFSGAKFINSNLKGLSDFGRPKGAIIENTIMPNGKRKW